MAPLTAWTRDTLTAARRVGTARSKGCHSTPRADRTASQRMTKYHSGIKGRDRHRPDAG